MASFSKKRLLVAAGLVVLLMLALFSPPPRCSSSPSIDSMVKIASTGEVVMKGVQDEKYLVVARVLDSHSLNKGICVLVTFKTDEPSVQDVMATLEKGDIITWTHLYPSDTSGYVSGWELAKGYDEAGALLGTPLERFDS